MEIIAGSMMSSLHFITVWYLSFTCSSWLWRLLQSVQGGPCTSLCRRCCEPSTVLFKKNIFICSTQGEKVFFTVFLFCSGAAASQKAVAPDGSHRIFTPGSLRMQQIYHRDSCCMIKLAHLQTLLSNFLLPIDCLTFQQQHFGIWYHQLRPLKQGTNFFFF